MCCQRLDVPAAFCLCVRNCRRMRGELAKHGHVSALQEDLIGDDMYTFTRDMVDFYGMGDRWPEVKKWQFCAGGLQGFVRGRCATRVASDHAAGCTGTKRLRARRGGPSDTRAIVCPAPAPCPRSARSDAERLVLRPVVNCSLHEEQCIAPKGSSRKNHNFDQTALTLMIWANNFSCLPRETHCMWSVKKASADPLTTSEPIEVVSRGHRLPKPYAGFVRKLPKCVPDKSKVPWPATGLEHQDSWSNTRYNLSFRISRE